MVKGENSFPSGHNGKFIKGRFVRWLIENDITEFITNNLTDCGIIHNLTDYYKISRLVAIAIDMYFTNNKCANNIFNFTNRSHHITNVPSSMEKTFIDKQIKHLRQLPQPEQKTPEWYKYRHGLITASNIYKVFASQSQVNSLIYEKCKPFNAFAVEKGNWHSGGSLQWGVLYEQVTLMIYEKKYNTNWRFSL